MLRQRSPESIAAISKLLLINTLAPLPIGVRAIADGGHEKVD